jgi:hypothetical protein
MGLSDCYASASAPNLPTEEHTKLMNAQRDEMLGSLATYKKDSQTREIVDLIEILTTMWCDPSRKAGSCFGDDITDVRLEYRTFKVDANGKKIPKTESGWAMCQIMQLGSNFNDTRTVIPADKFNLVVADDDGSNKRIKNLKDVTEQAKDLFPSEELKDGTNLGVKDVAVAYRMAFVPIPKADSGWQCEVRYVCYGYNTMTASKPKNALLFVDTMNTSIEQEKPGYEVGFQPLYTKVHSPFDPLTGASTEAKTRCFATSVEATNRSIADIGTETKAESAAAAAAGKGTQVRTGPCWDTASSSAAWHIAVPLEDAPDPADQYRDLGGGANMGNSPQFTACSATSAESGPCMRSLGADDNEGEGGKFRSLGAEGGLESAMDPEAQAAARAGTPLRAEAKEGRIGIGTYVCDATPLPHKVPVAKSTPAIATSIAIMTIDMGKTPDDATVLQACKELKKRHKLTANLGVEIESRASEEAVKAGLSTDAPHSKRTLDELEKTVGPEKAKGIAKENKVQLIAPGRPLLAGVPLD